MTKLNIQKEGYNNLGEAGATLVEYALLVAFISVICIVAINQIGNSISNQFSKVSDTIK